MASVLFPWCGISLARKLAIQSRSRRGLMPSSSISGAERAEDIAPAFEAIEGRADALYVIPDPIVNTNRIRINTLALGARLPTMLGTRDAVREAGLMFKSGAVCSYR
jgi:hypothetical protein